MGRLARRLIKWLRETSQNQTAIERIVIFYLWILDIRNPSNAQLDLSKRANRQRAHDAARDRSEGGADGDEWAWRGVLKVPAKLVCYQLFVNVFILYVLLENLKPGLYHWLLGWLMKPFGPPSMGPHCFVLGKFMVHDHINHRLILLICFYRLIWQLIVHFRDRSRIFSLYIFLTIHAHDLAKFHASFNERQQQCRHLESRELMALSIRGQRQCRCGLSCHLRCFCGDLDAMRQVAEMRDNASPSRKRSVSYCEPPTTTVAASDTERLFRKTLCYQEGDSRLIPRPNRIEEAHQVHRERLVQLALIIIVCVLGGEIFIGWLMLPQALDTFNYLERYPSCDPHLSELFEAEPLAFGPWWWPLALPLARGHYLAAVLVDVFLNFLVWTEAGYVILSNWTAVYHLNYDIELHWRGLHAKLERIYASAVQARAGPSCATTSGGLNWRKFARLPPPPLKMEQYSSNYDERDHDEVEAQVDELVAQFRCFFGQIFTLDRLASDNICFSIFICITAFTIFGDLLMRKPELLREARALLPIVFVMSFIWTTITVGCFCLFRIYSRCLLSIKLIYSMIAMVPDEQKRRLSGLVEYFVTTKRFYYTIMRVRPFKKSTYLSIFGWSISCFLFAAGFRRRA